MTQQNISRIEQEEEVDDVTLDRIAKVLGVSAEAIKNFDEEATVNIVSNFTSQDSSTINAINIQPTFNPVDKIVELYERLLQVEREKVELLERMLKSQSSDE
ncbi:transcriptional regulator [Pontibacter sp. HSC-14F20]|uniref:transcriptional regulator n=1 Tax=Pontibacter sp. HSC-14F20 TaxID=2864136 RepID=UPI002105810C|nr:transcriptional regulator [Pontibacter sp. HSC-14F20]